MAYEKKTWDTGDQVTHNELNKWETALDEHDKEIVKLPSFKEDVQKQIDVLSEKIQWKPNGWKTKDDLPSSYGEKCTTYFRTTNDWVIDGITLQSSTVVATTTLDKFIAKQEFFRHDGIPIYYRLNTRNDTWGVLKEIATSDEITALQESKSNKNNAEFTGTMKLNNKDIATTDKIDISLLNGNKPITIPVASKSGNIATINITLEFHNADICIVPFVPADTYYFKAENLISQQAYRGAIYKDGKVNLEEVPTTGDRIIINLPYTCV